MSIAGGVDQAPLRGLTAGCDTIQLFVKNNKQWVGKPPDAGAIERFRENCTAHSIRSPFAHNCYLVNLAAPNREIYERSVKSTITELRIARDLGLTGLVIHPGAHLGEGESRGIARIVRGINRIFRQTRGNEVPILLETTAGQGSGIGYRFEHLAEIIERVEESERLGVCVDTCHIFAAGYDLRTREAYEQTVRALEATIGLHRIRAFHLNDSLKGLGSRRDRHAHIGEGLLGEDAFRWLLNDPRWAGLPMSLETPKGEDLKEDILNLARLRGLFAR